MFPLIHYPAYSLLTLYFSPMALYMARLSTLSVNEGAFLDMLGFSEGTSTSPTTLDEGYDQIVGQTRFTSYHDHPNIVVPLPRLGISSTAAGRYQLLYRYWVVYKAQLHLPDFSPVSQDHVAMQLIDECHARTLINNGLFAQAVVACKSRWASLPGAGYGQYEHSIAALQSAYVSAGGLVT